MKWICIAGLWLCMFAQAEDKIQYVLYSQDNCPPCVAMKAALKEMGITYIEGVRNQYDGVTTTPTLVILKNNIEVKRVVGFTAKDTLEKELAIEHCVPETKTGVCTVR